ncbi:MAG: F0F1 ATP synthase subunit epsilon [Acidobacteriota bacterium]
MTPGKLQLEVVTPERLLLSEPVDEVSYRAREGYVGILPGHVPMLTSLEIGELTYRASGKTHHVAVSGGFVEVTEGKVIVLADTAEKASEIDKDRALAKKAQAEAGMKSYDSEDQFLMEKARLEKAVARLQAASHAIAP